MFITNYKVTAPGVIEEFIDNLDYEGKVLVKVDRLAICKADIRYFLGLRSQDVLNHKYPLTPIHEAVGHVVKDPTNTFKPGDKVILVPNSVDESLCSKCEHHRCHHSDLGSNYCPHAVFRSSSTDGFMKPFYACAPELLVKYNDSVEEDLAVFSELLSVSYAATRRIDFANTNKIAIFGDGIMAYVVYIILSKVYNKRVTVFGIDKAKLAMFKDADTTSFNEYKGECFDTLIECVGGKFSESAINQMIKIAQIGADLILMGVSEEGATIDTRRVLEKGLCIKGITRSTAEDFKEVAKAIATKEVQDDLRPMVISVTKINSIHDIYHCYEKDINNRTVIGKNILKF